jgi:PAS domain S-box-containing protein
MTQKDNMDEPRAKTSLWNSLRLSLLIWFLVLSLSPLIISSAFDYHHTKTSLSELSKREIEQSALLTKNFVTNWFYYRHMDIKTQSQSTSNHQLFLTYQHHWKNSQLTLAEYIHTQEWADIAESKQTDLLSFKTNFDYIYDVFLIDTSGNILFTLAKEADLGENLFTGAYANTKFSQSVQNTIKNNSTSFSGLERYAPSNNAIAGFLSAPMLDSKGELIGVISIQLSVNRIFESFKSTETSTHSIQHYVVGTDSLLRTPINDNWNQVLEQKIETKGVKLWLESINSKQPNSKNIPINYQGPNSKVIGMSHTIQVGDVSWGLISEIDETSIFSAASSVFNTMLITILVTILTILIASIFIARRFTNPISALAKASADFAQGKVQKIKPNQSSNEINQLISSFNSMLDLRESHELQLKVTESDFKRAQELLEEQKYALDQHSLVAITDIKGTITFANQKFSDISGYTIEELIGSNHRILNSGSHNTEFWNDMFKTVVSGKTWRNEVCNKAKDGSFYWVDTTIVPFMDHNNRPLSYIAIRTDITHKKQTELALEESSKQLKLIIENTSVGIWDWRIQDSTISFNDRWVEIIGYTLEELHPITIDTWLSNCHPDDLEESNAKLQKYWAGETPDYSMEVRMKHKSGDWVWVYSSGKVAEWGENKQPLRMIGTHLEINDRKLAEEALAKSDAASRGIFNSVADGIVSLDADGVITALNPAGEKIFNYRSANVIGKNITELMPESYRRSHINGFKSSQTLKNTQLSNKKIEVEGLRSDGSVFPLELSISQVKINNEHNFTATMRDISERKAIELQQKQQHKIINMKFNIAEAMAEQLSMEKRSVNAFEFILSLDFLKPALFSGVLVIDNNQNTAENEDESFKWYSKTVLPNEDIVRLERITKQCISSKGKNREYKATLSNTEFHYIVPIFSMGTSNSALGSLVFSANEPIKEFKNNQLVLNEISDIFASTIVQNNARHLLKEASLIAEQNSNLKSEFLASMSHEIRTPMNGVLGMLGLLLNSKLTNDQEDKVNLAKSSAESLLTLINDILDFSKVEAGKLTLELIDFDLRKMLGDFCDSMALHAQEKNIELILDVTNVEQSMVKGDSGRIRQILTNLVSNAIKFTPSGEIVISVSTEKSTDNKLSLSCSISDTGIGIPEDKISVLFDKFTQVDASTTREFGGTGLGLAISKKLCLLMNGDITARSKLGKGSQFDFNILLDLSEQSTQVIPSFNISQLNILIVDDNDTNRKVLNGQLSHWGASVIEASSGSQALDICTQYAKENNGKIFDIALLDMQMPEMDGAELGDALQQRFESMRLVMMTSISTENEAQYFADIGFSAFFTKPATTSDLFDTLAILSDDGKTLDQASPLITHEYIKSLDRSETSHFTEKSQYTWPEGTRLLIVEDNRINQHVALGILKEFNLTADIAGNGLEAITAIFTAPVDDPYTLVLMDCQMPEMDGYDATKVIRKGKAGESNQDIIIVAMTANAMEGDKEKCINIGMNDYLSKPIESERLIKRLHYWLIEQKGLNVSDFVGQQIAPPKKISEPSPESQITENTESNKQEKVAWDTETALSRVRGNNKLLAKLVDLYLEDMPDHIKALQQAVNNKDVDQTKRQAHSIRGASGNLYAYRMQDLGKAIETHILENPDSVDFNELSALALSFDDEYPPLLKLLEAFIENPPE